MRTRNTPVSSRRGARLAAVALAALLGLTGAAATAADGRAERLQAAAADTERFLTASSIARRIDKATQDNALTLLGYARAEIAAGRYRAAEQLIERAALPLHEMSPEAQAGHHPDRRQLLAERREALRTISAGAEKIAREKNRPTQFAEAARAAIERSRTLESMDRLDEALATTERAYLAVQREVARLRDGEQFYLRQPTLPLAERWADAQRRFAERRMMTEALIGEARAEGIDDAPLQRGLQEAERLLGEARGLAEELRFEKATASLELAYLTFEESWRQAGIDW